MKIIFASNNSGKILELQKLLEPFNITIIPQSECGVEEVPETELTFVENAILKARHASRTTGLPVIADDSGLEVQVLRGAPGIYSARFAGEKATSNDNIKKLLLELKNVPASDRQARFHCTLVYLSHWKTPTPIICEGNWYGTILTEIRGENGFGYDPVFFDPKENCTAAELPLPKKNQISHRGQALQLLMTKLKELNLCKLSP